MKLLKVLRSKWWDTFPLAIMLSVALLEGAGFWLGGVGLIIWIFILSIRHLVK